MGRKSKPAIGGRAIVSLGHESVYGQKVQPTHIIPFTNETLTNTEEGLESATITSNRGKGFLDKGAETVAGDVSFEHNPDGQLPLLYHAFGNYVKLENTNGGVYGISARDAKVAIAAVDGAAAREVIVLRDDTSSLFNSGGGLMAVVYKDANDQLAVDDNSGVGFDYGSYTLSSFSHVIAVDSAETGYTGYTTTAVVSIDLAPLTLANDTLVNPDVCLSGGVILVGDDRQEIPYFEAEVLPLSGSDPTGVRLYLDPAVAIPATPATHPSVNDFVIVKSTIMATPSFDAGMPLLDKGQFFLDFDTAYTDVNGNIVWTHFFERGVELPEGATVEVHRDAVMFTYVGAKVNTLSIEFAANSYVTGTFSLICQEEYSVGNLAQDVIPGASTIVINDGENFPATGKLRIGDETGMSYTGIALNLDGTYTITMATTVTTNPDAIQRHHKAGENVDPMSSNIVANPIHGNSKLLTTMSIYPYVDGYFEEVLSASLTLNNNIATDKTGLGSYVIFAAPEGEAAVEGALNFEFDDGINYNRYINATLFSVAFKGISNAPDKQIGATGVLKQVHYYVPNAKFGGTTPNVADKNYIQVEMPFMAAEDLDGKLSDLYCIIVNGLEEAVMN